MQLTCTKNNKSPFANVFAAKVVAFTFLTAVIRKHLKNTYSFPT